MTSLICRACSLPFTLARLALVRADRALLFVQRSLEP
jgi:hypothetical protein